MKNESDRFLQNLNKIPKSIINKTYNDFWLVDINSINQLCEIYNDIQEKFSVFVGKIKEHRSNGAPEWFKSFEKKLNHRLDNIEQNQAHDHELLIADHKLLMKVIKLNNLKTE